MNRLLLRDKAEADAANVDIRDQLQYVLTAQQQAKRIMARKDVLKFPEAFCQKDALAARTLSDIHALTRRLEADIAAFHVREQARAVQNRVNRALAYGPDPNAYERYRL